MTRSPVTTLKLERDGLSLSAQVYGEAHHPLVILIHGFPDTPHSWDGVVPELTEAGYQVLVPWLRGYTPASAKRSAQYGLLHAAQDILAWKDLLGAKSAHLVGHDWGAAIAMTLVSLAPKSWLSVSLLAVPPIPKLSQLLSALTEIPQQLRMSSYMLLMQSSWAEYFLSTHHAENVRNIWQRWSPSWYFSEADFKPTREAFSHPDIAWAASRYYRSLFSFHRQASRQGGSLLISSLSIPTLALAGLDDGCMNIRLHERLAHQAGLSTTVRAVYLAHCGHFLHAENPHAVASELLAHFRQHHISQN
jgi:pimeloyl-ACP methyl ester carboxylesterase